MIGVYKCFDAYSLSGLPLHVQVIAVYPVECWSIIRALQLKAVLLTYGIVCMCCVVCRAVGVLMVVCCGVQGAGGSSDWWGSVPPPEG